MGQRGTRSEYAAHAGVAPSYVTKLGKAGRLVLVKTERGELVDFDLTDRLVRNTADLGRAANGANMKPPERVAAAAASATAPPSSSSIGAGNGRHDVIFRQAQTTERVFDAKLAEFRYRRAIGEVVDRHQVDRAGFEVARELRDRFEAVARRIAPEVAALYSAEACEAVISREARAMLQSLADSLREHLGAPLKADA